MHSLCVFLLAPIDSYDSVIMWGGGQTDIYLGNTTTTTSQRPRVRMHTTKRCNTVIRALYSNAGEPPRCSSISKHVLMEQCFHISPTVLSRVSRLNDVTVGKQAGGERRRHTLCAASSTAHYVADVYTATPSTALRAAPLRENNRMYI